MCTIAIVSCKFRLPNSWISYTLTPEYYFEEGALLNYKILHSAGPKARKLLHLRTLDYHFVLVSSGDNRHHVQSQSNFMLCVFRLVDWGEGTVLQLGQDAWDCSPCSLPRKQK